MPNYANGRIYAIRAPGTDMVYIGSTTLPLSRRMTEHRCHYKFWAEGKPRYSSFKLIEIEGAYIELIEEFPCETKEQLNKREGEIIRATPNCVNIVIPKRTRIEYRLDNKEEINSYRRAYYASEKGDKIREYRAKNRDAINARRRQLRLEKKINAPQ